MERGSSLKNKFGVLGNMIKQVSFSSFKFSIADDRNSEILLWSLHGIGVNKHSLKFRFVK